jgi:hypothetical protein
MIQRTGSRAPARSRRRHIGTIVLMSSLIMLIGGGLLVADEPRESGGNVPNMERFHDSSGEFATFNLAGDIDTKNPFFQDLGTN